MDHKEQYSFEKTANGLKTAGFIKFMAVALLYAKTDCLILFLQYRKQFSLNYSIFMKTGGIIMKLFNIQDTRDFYETVLHCSGDIYEVQEDGCERDLKATAKYLIDAGIADKMKGIEDINIKIYRNEDFGKLFSYASRIGRERILI